jgi:hypothetical protein
VEIPAVASVSIKMKKHVAAAICGNVDAYPNLCMADGSGKRTRILRAPSRHGARGQLGGGGGPVALDQVEYEVTIKSSAISSRKILSGQLQFTPSLPITCTVISALLLDLECYW